LIRLIPARTLPAALVGLFLLSTTSRAVVGWWPPESSPFPNPELAAYVLTPCHMDGLFLGVLAAWGLRQAGVREFVEKNLATLWVTTAALAALAMWLRGASIQEPALAVYFQSVLAVFYMGLLLLAAHSPVASRFFRYKPLMFWGMISYGAYLFHQGILSVMHRVLYHQSPRIGSPGELAVTVLALGTTMLVAWLSYRYFESPILALGRKVHYDAPRDDNRMVVSGLGTPSVEYEMATLLEGPQ
jgi:peptidoglycan/LPS O-acetylase OafA/YrhL